MYKYKFFIPYFLTEVEVSPLFDKLKFRHEKANGTRIFRKRLTTSFTFINSSKENIRDFDFLYEIESNNSLRCTYLELIIRESCDNGKTYSDYYRGKFTLNKGKWDLNKCTFKTEVDILDRQTCLLENQNREVNILEAGPLLTLTSEHQDIPSTYEFYWIFGTGAPWPFSLVYTNATTGINIYAKEIATTTDIGGMNVPPSSDPAWLLVTGTGTTSTWERPYIGAAVNVVIEQTPYTGSPTPAPSIQSATPATIPGFRPYSLVVDNFEYETVTEEYTWQDYYVALPIPTINEYTQFRTLYSAVNHLVHQICPSINSVISDFFEWNPIGDAPGYIAGKNYVTGLDNVPANLAIAQKSDIVIPTASHHATIGKITFKKMMDQLKVIFNVDWFVDDSNNLRIEHIKYFTYAVGYDTTTPPQKSLNINNEQYEYDTNQMPAVERFKFMEAQSMDFIGKDIEYSGDCVTRDSENDIAAAYEANLITTDLNYIDNYPEAIDYMGFVIAAYYNNGTELVVHSEPGLLSGNIINNAHLSWANLHYNYHRHGRVLLTGIMNGVPQSFFTSKKVKIQKNVKLKICCNETFNPQEKFIRTTLGDGELLEGEEQNNTLVLSIAI